LQSGEAAEEVVEEIPRGLRAGRARGRVPSPLVTFVQLPFPFHRSAGFRRWIGVRAIMLIDPCRLVRQVKVVVG
jgi:hypothetical protein